ncbi:MAG: pilus assembly protein [Gammaproteobacteria bacterium]|nr:pilus assembly protein [Gammaproteobacteria bacterium]
MVEFIIITPVMLLLVFGALQFAFLYHAKTALNYAAFQTAREGAVNNAHMSIMELAFARNMAAIYTNDDTIAELQEARDRIRQEIEAGFVRIDVINPTFEMFNAFGVDQDGDRVIPNDNLMYRPLDTEPVSSATVQDANLLKLRITYCYPMYVPYVNRVLAIMLTQAEDPVNCPGCSGAFQLPDSFENNCLDRGRFPLNAQAIVRMQSPVSQAGLGSGTAGTTSGAGAVAGTAYGATGVAGLESPGALGTATGFWTLDTGRPAQTPANP